MSYNRIIVRPKTESSIPILHSFSKDQDKSCSLGVITPQCKVLRQLLTI